MTDRDVVVRIAEIFHRAVVATRPRQSHHKIPFVTTIKGAPAARMMRVLAPLMSPLRRAQIERALRDHRPIRRSTSVSDEWVTAGSELSWDTADNEARMAWLAGLLEGEGSFYLREIRQLSLSAGPDDHV